MNLVKSYHEVAYNTNTLAAFEMANLASFDTLTPSGIWNIDFNYYPVNFVLKSLFEHVGQLFIE